MTEETTISKDHAKLRGQNPSGSQQRGRVQAARHKLVIRSDYIGMGYVAIVAPGKIVKLEERAMVTKGYVVPDAGESLANLT
jgi:hypothetical protein